MKKLRVISRASFRRNSNTQFMTPAMEVRHRYGAFFLPALPGARAHFKMPNKKWGVARVKGSDPEQFFIFLINYDGLAIHADFGFQRVRFISSSPIRT